jgi:glutaredoxin
MLAKDWLTEHNCEYEELDITKDVEALREWRELSGGAGVPLIAYGKDIMIGFDPGRLERFVGSCEHSSEVGLSDPQTDGSRSD